MHKLIVLFFLLMFVGVVFLLFKNYGDRIPFFLEKERGRGPQQGADKPHWNPKFDEKYNNEDPTKRATSYGSDTMLYFTRRKGKSSEEYAFDWRGDKITIGRNTCCTIILPGSAIPRKMMQISRGIMEEKGKKYLGYTIEMLTDTEGVVYYNDKNKVKYLYKCRKKDALNITKTTEFTLPDGWKMKIIIVQSNENSRHSSRNVRDSIIPDEDIFSLDEEEILNAGGSRKGTSGTEDYDKSKDDTSDDHVWVNDDDL